MSRWPWSRIRLNPFFVKSSYEGSAATRCLVRRVKPGSSIFVDKRSCSFNPCVEKWPFFCSLIIINWIKTLKAKQSRFVFSLHFIYLFLPKFKWTKILVLISGRVNQQMELRQDDQRVITGFSLKRLCGRRSDKLWREHDISRFSLVIVCKGAEAHIAAYKNAYLSTCYSQ